MTIATITQLVVSVPLFYRYIVLFVLVMAEGPLVTMLAGLFAGLGLFNPLLAYAVIVLADLVSDIGYYFVGRSGMHFYSKKTSSDLKNTELLQEKIRYHQKKIIILGKWTHVFGLPLLFAAGASRIPFWRFVAFDGIATVPKSFVFLAIGYYMGQAAPVVDQYLTEGTYIMTGCIILLFVLYSFTGERFKSQLLSYLTR